MERNNKNTALLERDNNSHQALAPMTLLKHSGKAVAVGALAGAAAGALAGAAAGATAWGLWILGREAVKALRDRAGI
jgi:hypothetical protein